jgi:4-diphosphocytidyl-2-C-methyl-D-erythritol kinase
VPFFIRGGLQLGEGVGDRLTPLAATQIAAIVLVIPDLKIDTGWAYGLFADRQEFSQPPRLDTLLARKPVPWTSFRSDFEEVIFPQHPELRTIKEMLLEQGALHAGLSGSGSAVYGLFEKEPEVSTLPEMPLQSRVILTRPAVKP